jgi:hypothetical protein
MQQLYMPSVTAYRHTKSESDSVEDTSASIHNIQFMMPSEIVGLVHFNARLTRYEFKFRMGQAHSTIRDLQRALLLKSRLLISKKRYSLGTQVMTRSNALITEVGKWITQTAAKYNSVYSKLWKLSRELGGEETGDVSAFQVLKPEHLVGLASATDGPDSFKSLSWIWKVRSPGKTDTEVTKDGE